MEPFISFEKVTKTYRMGEVDIRALDGVDFFVNKGEFAIVVGPSGAGKSTILNVLGGMDGPSSGKIMVDGHCVSGFTKKQLTAYRRSDIGFVFQFYNLVQNLTAKENVELASEICENPLDAGETLDRVGLSDRKDNFPAQLSGGEQQRVAIARALAKNPKLLLCDEPTGALDSKTGVQVLSLLTDVCRTHNATVVIITHNAMIAPLGNRIIRVKNGGIESIETCEHPARVEDIAW